MVSFIVTIFRSGAFEVHTLIYLVTWQTPFAELAGRGTYRRVLHSRCEWSCLPSASPRSRGGSRRKDAGNCPNWSRCVSATSQESIWSLPQSDTWTLGIARWENGSFILNVNGCRTQAMRSALDSLMLYICLFTLNPCLHNCLILPKKEAVTDFCWNQRCMILERTGSAPRSLLSPAQGCLCHATIRHKGVLITESTEKPLEPFTRLVLLRIVSHRVSVTGMINKLLEVFTSTAFSASVL